MEEINQNLIKPVATPEQQQAIRRQKIALLILLGISALLGLYVYTQGLPPPAHLYDELAQCISHTSTTFYGAFWCPHCAEQKTKFGTGAQYLPYVECSLPSGSGQTQVCIDNSIKNYPTWVFSDGSRVVGVQTPAQLALKTGCAMPGLK